MKNVSTLTLKGFTLIELLIVITIIGILIVGLVPRIVGAPAKARDTIRLADLSQIATALEGYFSDNGTYPEKDVNNNVPACVDNTLFTGNYSLADYLRTIPADPQPNNEVAVDRVTCTKKYLYEPLFAAGATSPPYAGFILVANVESNSNGNTTTTGADLIENVNDVADPCTNDCDYYYLLR